MLLAEVSWTKVQEYFETRDTVLIPIGSIESHGRHNPLGVDTIVPWHLAQMIKDDLEDEVIITPTLPFGACESLAPYPGTIDLGSDLLYDLVARLVDQLWGHGARHFIFLNGHGGNRKTLDRIGLDIRAKGGLCATLNWWLMAWELNPEWTGGHGGGEETAAILGINKDLVDQDEITDEKLVLNDLSPEMKATGFNTVQYKGVTVDVARFTDEVTDSGGWIGPDHPNTATVEWGEEMLRAVADYILEFIPAFAALPLDEE